MYLRLRKEKAEEIRQRLIREGILDFSRKILSRDDFILIPIKEEISIPDAELVEIKGERIERGASSLKKALIGKLSEEELRIAPKSFDIIGEIAILEIPEELSNKEKIIGKALLETFKNIKTVIRKSSEVKTEFRTRDMEIIAGENRTETMHREHGCLYKMDIQKSYFSPRLSSERLRIEEQVKSGERVLVMFAGVGPYAILIAKKKDPKEVIAVELNPEAVEYMRKNSAMNKVNIKIIQGDVRAIVPKLGGFDRIVMPLPKDAGDFLDVALPALNKEGVIHFYDFSHSEEESVEKVKHICRNLGYKIKILNAVKCGSYSPSLYRICVDIQLM